MVVTCCFLPELKKKFSLFYGWDSTALRLDPLKFPEIPGTHFIDLERMKG